MSPPQRQIAGLGLKRSGRDLNRLFIWMNDGLEEESSMANQPVRLQTSPATSSTASTQACYGRRLLDHLDPRSNVIVRDPAPDASPPATPSDARTLTISC